MHGIGWRAMSIVHYTSYAARSVAVPTALRARAFAMKGFHCGIPCANRHWYPRATQSQSRPALQCSPAPARPCENQHYSSACWAYICACAFTPAEAHRTEHEFHNWFQHCKTLNIAQNPKPWDTLRPPIGTIGIHWPSP
jgi:hypothetical protein